MHPPKAAKVLGEKDGMEALRLNEEIRWQRSGRLRLRGLTRGDLALLSGDGVAPEDRRAQTFEAWPQAALIEALMRRHPDMQIAVEVDQCVVGGLLAWPRAEAFGAVLHPWSLREETADLGALRGDIFGEALDSTQGVLQGVGAVWPGAVEGAQVQKALQIGRQLLVQQRGCEATVSVVRAAGWRGAAGMSAPAYLQQVHARAIADARLSIYLDAGYMMRGYWQVGEAIEVLMRWAYRAH